MGVVEMTKMWLLVVSVIGVVGAQTTQSFGYGQQVGQGPNQNIGGPGQQGQYPQNQGQFGQNQPGQYPQNQGQNQPGQYPQNQGQFQGQGQPGQNPQNQGQFQGQNQPGQYPQNQDQFGQGTTPYGQGQDQYSQVSQIGLQNLVQTAPFYNQLTPQSQQNFAQIFNNPSQTKRQLYDSLAQFCRTQPYYIQSQLYTWSCQMLRIDADIVRQMQQVQLSPQATPFWQQIMRISWFNNLDVSLSSQTQQTANIIENAPPQVQQELENAAEQIQQSYDQRMSQLAQQAGANYNPNNQGQYGNQYGTTPYPGQQPQYDQNGNPIQSGQYNQGQYGQQPQYDQNGNPIQSGQYNQGQYGQQPQYDQNGNPIQAGQYNQGQGQFTQGQGPNNQGQYGQQVQYDQNGNPMPPNQQGNFNNQQFGSSPYMSTSTSPAPGGFGSG